MVRILAVAVKAVLREDRPDVPIVTQFATGQGGWKRHQEKED
jgi:hypothetical protein